MHFHICYNKLLGKFSSFQVNFQVFLLFCFTARITFLRKNLEPVWIRFTVLSGSFVGRFFLKYVSKLVDIQFISNKYSK